MRYDYRCESCEAVVEVWHGMTEDPDVVCNVCGGCMKRVISGGVGVIFKGSGWSTKAGRVKTQMAKRRAATKARQRDRYGSASIDVVPNYKGKTYESWSEVESVARKDNAKPVALSELKEV